MGKRTPRRKERRQVQEAALGAVERLSDDEIRNLRHEIGKQLNALGQQMSDLRCRLDLVRAEHERRRTATAGGLHISDHAVLRYLERIRGVDMAAVRAEIAELAGRADKRDGGRTGTRRDATSGLVLGVNETDGHVTTIFRDRELPVIALNPWRDDT